MYERIPERSPLTVCHHGMTSATVRRVLALLCHPKRIDEEPSHKLTVGKKKLLSTRPKKH